VVNDIVAHVEANQKAESRYVSLLREGCVCKQLLKYYGACNHTPHMLPPRTHPPSVAHRLSLTHLQANAEKITTIFAAFANDAGRVEGDDRIHALYSCCSMAKVHYRSSSAGSAHFCSRSSHTSHRRTLHTCYTRARRPPFLACG